MARQRQRDGAFVINGRTEADGRGAPGGGVGLAEAIAPSWRVKHQQHGAWLGGHHSGCATVGDRTGGADHGMRLNPLQNVACRIASTAGWGWHAPPAATCSASHVILDCSSGGPDRWRRARPWSEVGSLLMDWAPTRTWNDSPDDRYVLMLNSPPGRRVEVALFQRYVPPPSPYTASTRTRLAEGLAARAERHERQHAGVPAGGTQPGHLGREQRPPRAPLASPSLTR